MVRYLLFDLDGTLTDPKEGITKCFQYALEAFGITPPPADELTWVIGPPLMESFEQGCGFSEERAQEATTKYRERYEAVGWGENRLYAGVAEALTCLREAGFVLAVATSKPEHMAKRILEHFGLEGFFEVIGGATMDRSRSKKADVVSYTLERLGVLKREEALMIGDRKYDVEGAGQLGIPCLGVTWGYGGMEELEKAGAVAVAESMKEMTDYCVSLRK